ncbi:MAG: UDP-glucose 6-dehydrogenase [bacterium]
MKNTHTIGIIGCGFIGGALKQWVESYNPSVKMLISDPLKGFNDDVSTADAIFISIHIPTEESGAQDLSTLKQIIRELPDKPIFVRTTILPGTSELLSKETSRRVYFMPEFLTQRTAYADFCSQPMVFTAERELLQKIFVGKEFVEMSSFEAEVSKYAHNVFGAVKVTYFNGIYDYCQKNNADYDRVLQGVLLSGYINDMHARVPGPDGKLGYGGKCFPKDVNALTEMTKGYPLHALLKTIKPMNLIFRGADV